MIISTEHEYNFKRTFVLKEQCSENRFLYKFCLLANLYTFEYKIMNYCY
jgi:hypothetical protein